MGKTNVVSSRAIAAGYVSSLMINPTFHRDLAAKDLLDADGEVPLVVAGADESAVITIHRMERTKASKVVLATYMDGNINIVVMKAEVVDRSAADAIKAMDVVGGVTVRDWLQMINEDRAPAYHASGSDIMSTVDASTYAVV